MTIQIGDHIPEVNIKRIDGGFETIDTHAFFEGKKLLLFAVPDEETRSNHYEIGIPKGASLILKHDPEGEVKGLIRRLG